MRDAVIIDLNENTELVITTDGCTGVGKLKEDLIDLDIYTVAWTACKVALMELLSLGAYPIGYAFNHVASPDDYNLTVSGILQCMGDFGQTGVPFISSSEKNFQVSQTTITIALTGVREKKNRTVPQDSVYLLIGEPMVGQEVLENPDRMITPLEFKKLIEIDGIHEVVPLGSQGVMPELELRRLKAEPCELDLRKSAGPASCVLAAVSKSALDTAIKQFGDKCRIVSYGIRSEKDGKEVLHA